MKHQYFNISSQQQENGSFLDAENNQSILHTALILSCLNQCSQDPSVNEVREKAVKFLLSKKDADWKFFPEASINFHALAALAEYDKDLIDGGAMAKILINLTSLESQEGGPYFSQVGSKDVDLAVNASIANFLFLEGVELPELTVLFENAIKNKYFKSSFYASDYPTIYFISKFYRGGCKQEFVEFVLERYAREKETVSPLEMVLILDTLLNLGYQGEKIAESLAYLERSIEGLDLNYAFYVDDDGLIAESTASLNGALYLEGLSRNDLLNIEKSSPNKSDSRGNLNVEEKGMMDKIMRSAEKRFANLPAEVQDLATLEIRKTISGNRDNQMSLMAYYMKKALGSKASGISDSLVAEMGLANVFFWTAFIIYDDFWDEDEAANTAALPVANLFARSYVDFFDFVLPSDTGFHDFFHKLMDGLDAANTWENIHCRAKVEDSRFFIPENLPDYGEYELKYQPASGQILGPVAMLVQLGHKLKSSEVQNLIAYFRNYLIAMQINDDAHDWEEDMQRGHLSTVVTLLLKDLDWPKRVIDLETDLEELKKVFWFKTINKAAEAAASYAEKSRQALKAMATLEDIAPLEKIIIAAENVALKALKEQNDTVNFLKAYK